MVLAIAFLIIIATTLLAVAFLPSLDKRFQIWQQEKQDMVEKELDDMFYDQNPKHIVRLYLILPPSIGFVLYFFTNFWLMGLMGAMIGLFVPTIILKSRNSNRKARFNNQLLDAVMVISSALKGGLSFLQSLEVVEEELPAPISQEFGLVIRENKIGVPLEESLKHLEKRMGIDELSLLINSILVARETGGDLTKVLSRLGTTIRDNRKLKESIKTLTLQGRLQGIIMSALPIMFVWWVMVFNKEHFSIMLNTDLGKMLLTVAIILQILGMLLIAKFSKIKV